MVRLALLILAASPPSNALLDQASVHGKYEGLVQTFTLPGDVERYGQFNDFGYWKGGAYESIPNAPAGYWVYVAPDWYVWKSVAQPPQPEQPEQSRPSEHHAPQEPAPYQPRADNPLAPAERWLIEHKLPGAGLKPQDRALGGFTTILPLANGTFLVGARRDDRTEEEKNAKDREGYAAYVVNRQVPLIVLLDSKGAPKWERSFTKKGFVDYGAPVVAESKDGRLLALVPSYVHPARMTVTRVLELDRRTGDTIWERQLRGAGDLASPSVRTARLTDRGTVALEGHIYLEHGEDEIRDWRGEVGLKGELLEDRDGPLRTKLHPVRFDEHAQGWLGDYVSGAPGASRPAYLFALKQHIALADPKWHLAPLDGRLVPVAARADGSWILVGVREEGWPVVIAVAANGEPLWERGLAHSAFDGWGGGLATEAPDGKIVVALFAFKGWERTVRVLALLSNGETLWDRTPKGNVELEHAQLTRNGTLKLRGFAYADPAYHKLQTWEAQLDLTGHWLSDKIGGPRPKPGTMTILSPP